MDQATKQNQLIEHRLNVAEASWKRLPQVEKEFSSWHPEDQEVFVLEWSIEDDRLRRLEASFKRGAMTEEQAARYADLKTLVSRNRPIIERLADR
jgi:hypothetical protein